MIKNLLGKFFALLRYFFMSIGILVTILYILLIITLLNVKSHYQSSSSQPKKSRPDKPYILVSQPRGVLSSKMQSEKSELFSLLFETRQNISIGQLKRTIEAASKDKNVKGVFLDLTYLQGGLGEFGYLMEILKGFRAANKEVWIHSSYYSTSNYITAAQANHISLSPVGSIELTGPAFQLVYFGDAAKKLGVQFNVFRAGKYKSAFEPLVANSPSEPTLEEMRSIESSIRQKLIVDVASGRGADLGYVSDWFKKSYFNTNEAKNLKMIDSVLHHDTALDDFLKKLELKSTDKFKLEDYTNVVQPDDEQASQSDGKGLALIEANGTIYMDSDEGSDEQVTAHEMLKKLKWAEKQKNVRAVVLRVNSPGGSALASEIIWDQVVKLASKKPVVVSMGAVAASGGYYISAPAQKIFAEASTITGSIGVIGMVPSLAAFKEKYGINFHMITGTDRKALLNLGEAPSKEDEEVMAKSIDEVYESFLARVAEGRKKTRSQIHQIAQGRVYTGSQAKDIGLVDQIGGVYEAIAEAKTLAGLDPKKLYPLYQYRGEELGLWECLSMHNLRKCLKQVGGQTRSGLDLLTQLDKDLPIIKDVKQLLFSYQRGEKIYALWMSPRFIGAN